MSYTICELWKLVDSEHVDADRAVLGWRGRHRRPFFDVIFVDRHVGHQPVLSDTPCVRSADTVGRQAMPDFWLVSAVGTPCRPTLLANSDSPIYVTKDAFSYSLIIAACLNVTPAR